YDSPNTEDLMPEKVGEPFAQGRGGMWSDHLDPTHPPLVHQPSFHDGRPWNPCYRNCGRSSSITFSSEMPRAASPSATTTHSRNAVSSIRQASSNSSATSRSAMASR